MKTARTFPLAMSAASIPVGLVFASLLLSWGWRLLSLPGVVQGLTPPEFLAALVLVGGAVLALRRGVPAWSYSWIALCLASLGIIASQLSILAFGVPEGNAPNLREPSTLSLAISSVLWVFLALMTSLSLASRGMGHALFFFCLFLAAKVPTFPVLVKLLSLSPAEQLWATGALAVLATIEGVVLMLLLHRFLASSSFRWGTFWLLLTLVLADSPLKFWYLLLQDAGADRPSWFDFRDAIVNGLSYDLLLLLVTFAAVSFYLALGPKRARPPDSSTTRAKSGAGRYRNMR